jgi:hypothetical protein
MRASCFGVLAAGPTHPPARQHRPVKEDAVTFFPHFFPLFVAVGDMIRIRIYLYYTIEYNWYKNR